MSAPQPPYDRFPYGIMSPMDAYARGFRRKPMSPPLVSEFVGMASYAPTYFLNLIIQEFRESGGSIARHSHEFGCERGRRQHPLEPPSLHVHGGHEAVGEPVAWRSWQGQRGPSR